MLELFRVTRNAITERDEEEADDLLEMIEIELRERKFAPVVRLAGRRRDEARCCAAGSPPSSASTRTRTCSRRDGMLGQRDLMEIARSTSPSCAIRRTPRCRSTLLDRRNIFHAIRERRPILAAPPVRVVPSSVERFLREAADDPKVPRDQDDAVPHVEGSDGHQAPVGAARNGKQVAVVLELKARFDEEANISGRRAWSAPASTSPTASSASRPTRRSRSSCASDYDGLRRYAHIATGNYHAGTARLYTDLGLFTCDDASAAT